MRAIPILSGIPRQEILEYFQTLGVQLQDEEDKEEKDVNIIQFTIENCEIQIFPTIHPSNFVISIPRTKIIFQGPENQVTQLVSNFRKKFLRGGG
ncbi:MAG: hypothetical protein E4G98_02975 [Promethearchaeota archaeon]|nr:MAG: hypothetical protein E4G98_02975 [Candidatus Lokiarchaeota archaeon]